MSDTTEVPNITDNAVSGLDHTPLTPRKPSLLAGAHRDREAEASGAVVEDPPAPLADGGDPSYFNVNVVNDYLAGLADDEAGQAERRRVLDAEGAGKGRVTVG